MAELDADIEQEERAAATERHREAENEIAKILKKK